MNRLRPVELPAGSEVRQELGVKLLDPEDQVGHLVGDAVPHVREDLHPFALVLDLRVDLGIALEPDRAAEVVHGPEVFHPARVEDLEQEDLLHLAHLGPVAGVEGIDEGGAGLVSPLCQQVVGGRLDAQLASCPGGKVGQGRRVGG